MRVGSVSHPPGPHCQQSTRPVPPTVQRSVGSVGVCGAGSARPSASQRLRTLAPASPRSSTWAFGGPRLVICSSTLPGSTLRPRPACAAYSHSGASPPLRRPRVSRCRLAMRSRAAACRARGRGIRSTPTTAHGAACPRRRTRACGPATTIRASGSGRRAGARAAAGASRAVLPRGSGVRPGGRCTWRVGGGTAARPRPSSPAALLAHPQPASELRR